MLRDVVLLGEDLLVWKWLGLRSTSYLDLVMFQLFESVVMTGIEKFV